MKQLIFDYENMGGIMTVYAIPPSVVDYIHKDYESGMFAFSVTDPDKVIEIPVICNDTFSFSEDKKNEDAGESWYVDIDGVIPKISSSNANILEELEHGEWYVLCQDHNGVIHLSGREGSLMTFTDKKSSGNSAASRNGISFTFSCIQPLPSYIIASLPV